MQLQWLAISPCSHTFLYASALDDHEPPYIYYAWSIFDLTLVICHYSPVLDTLYGRQYYWISSAHFATSSAVMVLGSLTVA